MATFQQLYEVTEQLYKLLKEPLPVEDREEYIEQIEILLEKRQHCINSFQVSPATSELVLANEIVQMNKEITEKLKVYMNIIKIDINKLKQQKEKKLKYENPYDHQTDGYFIDKKN